MEKQKTRDEILEQDTWDLSKIFKTEQEFLDAKENVKKLLDKVVSFKGKILDSSDTLYDFYKADEELTRESGKVYMYAKLLSDSDTKNNHNKALSMQVDKMFDDIFDKTSFIRPEMLSKDYELVLKYIEENDKLKEYAHLLENKYRYKEHVLNEKEEKIIAQAANAFGTGHDVFYNFDNADINLGTIHDEDGNEVELTNSNYIKYMNSRNREVRIDAFNHMYNYFKSFKNTLAASYTGQIKENFFMSKVKKYESPLAASLFNDSIDKKVYETLINTIHNKMDAMYDYMELRKKALGYDELHMYDVYVDIINSKEKNIPFEEGKKIVFDALKPLGEQYLKDLQKAFDERWIDKYPNKGKKSGAYSWGVYDTYPYLLLNYDNTVDSVSTMAHELGHSMHSYYSIKNQNCYNSEYPIFLAEIASTVNEVLLNDYLYKNAETKEEKILYLVEFLDKVRTTIYRQTMFAEFEMIVHDKYDEGVSLTSDMLCDTYYELNKLYYGPNVISDDLIRYEWSRIPHFYSSFYVYKYATGLSAAISIASDILSGKEGSQQAYLNFLSSGGSDYPLNILKKVDVDMTDEKPILKAIKMFEDKLSELKELIN